MYRRRNSLNSSAELKDAAGQALVTMNRALELVENIDDLLRENLGYLLDAYEGADDISVDYCNAMTALAQKVIDSTARINNFYNNL